MNTDNYYLFYLSSHDDSRGRMCVGESGKDIPFIIKRIFFNYNNKNSSETRGNHANVNSQFVCVCLHGTCTIKVNDGINEEVFTLDDPRKALYINKMIWKEMYDYSEDSVLLILSDCIYNPNEYINDFNVFLENRIGGCKK